MIKNLDPCQHCINTSSTIDSLEARVEELQAELLAVRNKLKAAEEALEREERL